MEGTSETHKKIAIDEVIWWFFIETIAFIRVISVLDFDSVWCKRVERSGGGGGVLFFVILLDYIDYLKNCLRNSEMFVSLQCLLGLAPNKNEQQFEFGALHT